MSWPALGELVKAIDVYRGQNWADGLADRRQGRINWNEVARQNPEILHIIPRVAGADSGVDPDFAYNYEEGVAAGFTAGCYVNVNPARSITGELVPWWKAGLGDRRPKSITVSVERGSYDLSNHVLGCIHAVQDLRPEATIDLYAAAWFWDSRVKHGWEAAWANWGSHYPYFVQDPATGEWRQARTFEEVDGRLPISNPFTPKVAQGWTVEQVAKWQFSEQAVVAGIARADMTPRADLDYVRRAWYEGIYGPIGGAEPPAAQPVPIVVRIPRGRVLVSIEEV